MTPLFVTDDARAPRGRTVSTSLLFVALGALSVAPARAQLLFSIDYKGARSSATASGGILGPIRESDVLLAPGGSPGFHTTTTPQIAFTGAQLGLPQYTNCSSLAPGFPCHIEVDALSTGRDKPFNQNPVASQRTHLFFSVDVQAVGRRSGTAPTMFTEAQVHEAAADIFELYDVAIPPLDIGAIVPRNVLVVDGNGSSGPSGFTRRGLGLVEPHAVPVPPPPPSPPYLIGGDDVDAIALHPAGQPMPFLFFSLDAAFPDPLTGIPNSGSAAALGSLFPPGAVIVVQPGGSPLPYARTDQLGLDIFGVGTDDIDVIILFENGTPGYQKSQAPYDWLPVGSPGASDMLMFSLRRGSALINNQVPDSEFGRQIEAGDLLRPPYGTPLATTPPGIWIAAENLGLRTRRSDPVMVLEGDDLDGGATGDLCYDCNNNNIEDAVDISTGSSVDVNGNGVPDECETSVTTECDCPIGAPPPCGNAGAVGHGCGNSAFAGGALLTASGPSSVAFDALTLNASDLTGSLAIFFQGASTLPPTIVDDGIGCVGGPIIRLGNKATSGNESSYPLGGDPLISVRGMIPAVGGTYYYQCYYRNAAASFCPPATSNRTNGLEVVWFP